VSPGIQAAMAALPARAPHYPEEIVSRGDFAASDPRV
jgi:hypothetical protein